MNKYLFILITFLLLIAAGSIQAQIPRTLSYQGVLTDTTGNPKPDGSYNLVFRMYDVASGGSALWSESETVTTKRGLFSTILGDGTAFPSSMNFDEQYWLSIQVDATPELSPRIPLTAVGYSMHAISADTAYVTVTSVGDTLWKKSESNIYRLTGNVGIGTLANNVNRLLIYVSDTVSVLQNAAAQLAIGNESMIGNNWGLISFHGADLLGEMMYAARIGTQIIDRGVGWVSGDIVMSTVNSVTETERMRIKNNGFVGIGTINPSEKFEVLGNVKINTGSTDGGRLIWKGGTSGNQEYRARVYIDGSLGFFPIEYGSTTLSLTQNGNVGIGTMTPGYKLDVDGDLNLAAGSVYRIGGVAQTGSSKWTQGSGDNIYRSSGNVGIGTASPSAKLTLGSLSHSPTFSNGAVYIDGCNDYFDYFCGMVFRGSGGDWATRFTATSNMGPTGEIVGIYREETTPGDASAGIGSLVTFRNDGNVGIGITTPGYKLDVNGDMNLAAGSVYRIGGVVQTGSSKWTQGSGDNIYRQNGYIGIGTSNPLTSLHIAGIGWVGMDIQTLTSGGVRGSYLNFGDLDDRNVGAILYNHDNNLMTFNTNDTTRLAISQSGNIGIGTTTPQEEIHIAGTSSYQLDSRPRIRIENLNGSGDNGTAIGFQGRNAWFALGTDFNWDGGDNLYILDGHTQEISLLINSLGYLGIGTTNPQRRLHILSDEAPQLRLEQSNGFCELWGGLNFHIVTGTEHRLFIDGTNGNIGVGMFNPPATLSIKVGGTTLADAWSIRSSRRWKTNIEPLQNSLEKVKQLQGVSFNWNESGKSDIGLIAEEVGAIVPEVVSYEENGIDAKSVDYAKLVALLIEAMKDQQKQIDELKAEMNSLNPKPTE